MNNILFFAAGFVIAIVVKTIRDRFLILKVRRPKDFEDAKEVAVDLIGPKMVEVVEYVQCVSRATKLRASSLVRGLAATIADIADELETTEDAFDEQQ